MHHNHNTSGIIGNRRDEKGNTVFVEVPKEQWEKIETAVTMSEELVDGVQVQKELRISKKTLANMCACGKIPRSFYTIAINGIKFFYNKKILGIKKN